MKDKEILLKAIKIAISHGYRYNIVETEIDYSIKNKSHYVTIFNSDFARCFWSEPCEFDIWTWEHHLKEMVLYEEPLKYLERFIK